ncbi:MULTISPECIES: hypothetical protein [unclassified Pseudomonas]|nr:MULTISPECIES: hypothetical protein [unclassified Pseudomonas]
MSAPTAGTTKKGMFSRNDYLAPLPLRNHKKPAFLRVSAALKDGP